MDFRGFSISTWMSMNLWPENLNTHVHDFRVVHGIVETLNWPHVGLTPEDQWNCLPCRGTPRSYRNRFQIFFDWTINELRYVPMMDLIFFDQKPWSHTRHLKVSEGIRAGHLEPMLRPGGPLDGTEFPVGREDEGSGLSIPDQVCRFHSFKTLKAVINLPKLKMRSLHFWVWTNCLYKLKYDYKTTTYLKHIYI